MDLPSQSQVVAASRHVVTSVASIVGTLAALHLINGGDANTITQSVTLISDGVAKIAAGLTPLIVLATTLYSTWSASHQSQITSVKAIPGVEVVKEGTGGVPVSAPPITKGT